MISSQTLVIRIKKGLVLPVILLALLAFPAPSIPTASTTTSQMNANWGEMPLYFIANEGQADSRVAFYVQGNDKTLYFTSQGVTFALASPASPPEKGGEKNGNEQPGRWIVKLDFLDANIVQPRGEIKNETVFSYFKGAAGQWHTGLPTYSNIIYPNLWDGIDLVFSGTVHRLKYEFLVHPGADPTHIRLAYHGAKVGVNEAGQLEVSTPAGGFQDQAPVAYQIVDGQRRPVSAAFAFENIAASDGDAPRPYGFHLGAYDPNLPLVIDPEVLVYCGYIGGTSGDGDFGTDIALDDEGNAYITGYAHSTEASFPVKVGPDLNFNGIQDAFVAKVRADGTGLVYAGFIGGSDYEWGNGIAVDKDGNAYITGDTYSSESTFPVTVGPDLTYNGASGKSDVFVAKVNPDGTGLVYAGYIGGSGAEVGNAIAVDLAGNAYITGFTYSYPTNGFPVLVGPGVTHNGYTDAFVAKVKADGTGLLYSGYIGGGGTGSNGFDEGWGIAVDSDGLAYVTGITSSSETTFPVAVGPDLTYNGGPTTSAWDSFIAKVEADGSGLVYAGYIGGSEQDYGTGIAVDAAGNAYVTGYTNSTQATFPVLVGPDLTYNGDYWDAFVTKVKPDGSGLLYSGYIGGDQGDTSQDIAVDASGNAYIAGGTDSTQATFPVVGGPDLAYNGYGDAFVAKIKYDGTQLLYAGYVGGSSGDNAHGIAIDPSGSVYITGDTCTKDGTFPTIVGPDLTFNGASGYDAFVAKISTRTLKTLKFFSTGTQDGWLLESGENTLKGGMMDVAGTTLRLGDDAARKQYRSLLSFSTSILPDNALIMKVTLKLRRQGITGGGNPVTTFKGFMVDIRKGPFGTSALQLTDWQAAPSKAFGPFNTAVVGGWYSIDLTAAKAYINKLSTYNGLTQIRLRLKLEDNNDTIANYLSLYSGDAGATSRPQLIIEYYVP